MQQSLLFPCYTQQRMLDVDRYFGQPKVLNIWKIEDLMKYHRKKYNQILADESEYACPRSNTI